MAYYDFFISYNRRDAEIARKISTLLAVNGIACWYAESEILLHGRRTLKDKEVLKKILKDAANQSRYCLYLFSNNSIVSDWIHKVELPLFIKKESKQRQFVFPLQIDHIEYHQLPLVMKNYPILNCQTNEDLYTSVKSLLRTLDLKDHSIVRTDQFLSRKLIDIQSRVTTQNRKLEYSFKTGVEWKQAGKPSISEGMVYFAKNERSGIVLNLIIGMDPIRNDNSDAIEIIEEDNYFGDRYVKEELLSWSDMKKTKGFRQKLEFIVYYLKYKIMISSLPRRKVVGSHMFNIMNRPHFAFTYFMGNLINRKYSIYYTPSNSKVSFEFVFTASYQGTYEEFLARIGQVDAIVKSLKIVEYSID